MSSVNPSDSIQGAANQTFHIWTSSLRIPSLDCHYSDAGVVPASFSSKTKGKVESMNSEHTLARGLRKLPEDEQRIIIEEASEVRTFASRGRAKHLLGRFDDLPQTIYDEASA